jgi:hypothetical protein
MTRLNNRLSFLAALIGGPVIIASFGLCVLETWRWIRPEAPLFATPVATSLADAIASDDVSGAYKFIRAGQDPNAVIPIQHPVFTGGHPVEVLPLIWAVATQSRGTVAMLLGSGSRLDAATKHQAICLADQLGRADIVHLLRLSDTPPAEEPCPVRNGAEGVPLLTSP